MAISFLCDQCGQKLQVPDEMAGREGKCPSCQAAVIVPATSTEGAGMDAGAGAPGTGTGAPAPTPAAPSGTPPAAAVDAETRPCPHCGGHIRPEARKCKHCGQYVEAPAPSAPVAGAPAPHHPPQPYGVPAGHAYGPPAGAAHADMMGHRAGPPPTDGWCVASLVIGIMGWSCTICYGVGATVPGTIALILGLVGRSTARNNNRGGAGLATAGIVTGIVGILLGIGVCMGIVNMFSFLEQPPQGP